ncbi:MAG: ABC transporter permease [Chloroflexi bacterium]|nr:ABC transporter permease [Chloroflexota bacterium]
MKTTSVSSRALMPRVLADSLKDYGLIGVMIVVILFFSLLTPSFLTINNAVGIIYQVSIIGIMAVCSTFVVITGGIDLSVGSIMALSGLFAYFTLEATGQAVVPALAAGAAIGILVGLVNGIMVAQFKLPPIVVTLAMMSIARGLALLIGEASLHLIRGPASFLFIGSGQVLGLPLPIYIFAAAALIVVFVQVRTPLGFAVFAIGENEAAARLAGIGLLRTKIWVYALSGVGAAVAGIILASQVHTASAVYGDGYELDVIASIVLGGTSLMGGSGSAHRSVIGALLMGIINNGLSVLNVDVSQQLIVKGLIIVVALALDHWLQRDK